MEPDLILQALQLCSDIYSPYIISSKGEYRPCRVGNFITEYSVVNDRNLLTSFIIFQGSNGGSDWWRNFKAYQVYTSTFDCEFHKGFLQQATTFFVDFIPLCESLVEYDNVVITGHSQGAAIAGIASLMLHDFFSNIYKVCPILVACPRFTCSYGKTIFNQLFPDAIRVVNGNDIITHIPFDLDLLGLDYEHVGNVLQIGDHDIIPSSLDHPISAYIKSYKIMHNFKRGN